MISDDIEPSHQFCGGRQKDYKSINLL